LAELGSCAQLLFEGLWCIADREGKLEDRPKRIKAEIFPYYDPTPDTDILLYQLQERGFIVRYAVNGLHLIKILNFSKHQTPHVRESASNLPEPEQCMVKALPWQCQGAALEDARHCQDRLTPDSGLLTP
jgi:hypothetical protein